MENRTVLVSGASIAGPALAWWLHHHGFCPTVVERAPGLRRGGQAIDIRGAALTVVERMGLLDGLRDARTAMRGMSIVDGEGHELMRTTETTLTGGATDSADIELLRDDLTDQLYAATRDDVEYRFGDAISDLQDDGTGVTVTFERGPTRRFDLVVGADGLHSDVRRRLFGNEATFARFLGVYLAVFTVPNHLGLDHWQTFHHLQDGTIGMYSARKNTEARAILGFRSPLLDIDPRDIEAQKRLLAERFAGVGWEAPRLLEAMWGAPDFHFDAMSQIVLPAWSKGRIALVGDAGYCGSPMTGQGTSLALVGACVLAWELAAAGGDHHRGFSAYEERMRPFVAVNQALVQEATEGPLPGTSVARASNAIILPPSS
jgi:2-polyprenyl-6-methoxyphenol hydroxylase-like FAD-dependent oxidoreductase